MHILYRLMSIGLVFCINFKTAASASVVSPQEQVTKYVCRATIAAVSAYVAKCHYDRWLRSKNAPVELSISDSELRKLLADALAENTAISNEIIELIGNPRLKIYLSIYNSQLNNVSFLAQESNILAKGILDKTKALIRELLSTHKDNVRGR